MKKIILAAFIVIIGSVVIGYILRPQATYASIDPAGRHYLSDEYTLSLDQFKEVWVKNNSENCEEGDLSCGYWDREYDGPVTVKQNGTVALELDKQTGFYFEEPKLEGAGCVIFTYGGELFFIAGDDTRQFVSDSGWEGFMPKEGVYEADLYAGCVHQVRNDSFLSRLFAWLKPVVAYAAPYGNYIGTLRFTVIDKNKKPLTLQEKAADLAKQVITAPYLGDGDTFGGKGWDSYKHSYVDVASIFNGYNFWNQNIKHRQVEFGAGLDCSGLVEWAYNYSFDPQVPLEENAIRVPGADAEYINNSTPISESELKPGDLLFLGEKNGVDITHVAMYVGDFVDQGEHFDIVEAFSVQRGIVPASRDLFEEREKFKNLGISNAIRRVVLSPEIAGEVKVGSPVDITVTDPEGITITHDIFIQTDEEYLREVPGELYYSERELGHDGRPEDTVYWFKKKVGDYHIQVIPEKDTQPTDTYSVEFILGGNTIKLAENVPISEIPEEGYYVNVGENQTVESSGEVTPDYLLGKIREHIQSFGIKDGPKKALLVLTSAIEKRLEINNDLQNKLQNQIDKLKGKPNTDKAVQALEKQLEKLKENEKTILENLSSTEKAFAEKSGQILTNKDILELSKLLTKTLLAFSN